MASAVWIVISRSFSSRSAPTRDDRFIAFVKRILEIHQADHPSGVDARSPAFLGVAIVDCRVELLPVDLPSKHVKRVLGVEKFAQLRAKELALRNRLFRLYCLPALGTNRIKTWQILAPSSGQCTLYCPEDTKFIRDD